MKKKTSKPASKSPAPKKPAMNKSPSRPKRKAAETQSELTQVVDRLDAIMDRLNELLERMAELTRRLDPQENKPAKDPAQHQHETAADDPPNITSAPIAPREDEQVNDEARHERTE